MKQKTNKKYESPEGLFLTALRQKIKESPAQREERLKHTKIHRRRDDATTPS